MKTDKSNLTEHFKKLFLAGKDPFTDILGQEHAKMQLKSALITDRHVLIVGPPGIGKTTITKNISAMLPEIEVNACDFNCDPADPMCPACLDAKQNKKKVPTKRLSGPERFVRIQGSPDLTAEDLLGDIDPIKAMEFGPLSFQAFTPGKIFKANNGVLFFDEINRCPEKLQNALLQVLSERKATIGSHMIDFPARFIFIGTMNPEDSSTERLSDVFMDRFDVIYMGYPETLEIEKNIVKAKGKALEVKYPEQTFALMISFVRTLRHDKKIEKKPSVRASIGLYERSQANAILKDHKHVTYEDVKDAIISVLSHRIKLVPSAKYLQSPEEYIKEEFKKFSEQYSEGREKESDVG